MCVKGIILLLLEGWRPPYGWVRGEGIISRLGRGLVIRGDQSYYWGRELFANETYFKGHLLLEFTVFIFK